MIVVGLDASLDRIGWGLARDGRPLACGCEPVRPPDSFISQDPADPRRPEAVRLAVERVHLQAEQHAEMSEGYLVFVEGAFAGPNPAITVGHALAVGSCWQAAHRVFGEPPELLMPAEWQRVVDVPRTPKEPGGRRSVKGVALREHAVQLALGMGLPEVAAELRDRKPEKPLVYLRARAEGFEPRGSQDAADAGLLALAGWRVATSRWQEPAGV